MIEYIKSLGPAAWLGVGVALLMASEGGPAAIVELVAVNQAVQLLAAGRRPCLHHLHRVIIGAAHDEGMVVGPG